MNADTQIQQLRTAILDAMRQTSVRDEVDRIESSVSGGKMIRGRLVLDLGTANGLPLHKLVKLGAAIELLHAGSLLHDDIIDGGTQRRSHPALWVAEGVKSAVLIGDLLLSVSLKLVLEDGSGQMPTLVHALHNMCNAEAEQEFASGGDSDSWDDCVRIARHKTGVLFGLAAACAAGDDRELSRALEAAGSDLGTAYQLADDLLDICPHDNGSGKSLGTDAASGKLTAARFGEKDRIDHLDEIEQLLEKASGRLRDRPEIHKCWIYYVERVIRPILHHFTKHTLSP